MSEIKLTMENFEDEIVNSKVPVIVDFWADWCGPCRMLAPIIAEIAEENQGKIKVGKVNVDEEPEIANAFQISSIPTVLGFKDGKLVGKSVGYQGKDAILALIK